VDVANAFVSGLGIVSYQHQAQLMELMSMREGKFTTEVARCYVSCGKAGVKVILVSFTAALMRPRTYSIYVCMLFFNLIITSTLQC
jgi:hypothetical protein